MDETRSAYVAVRRAKREYCNGLQPFDACCDVLRMISVRRFISCKRSSRHKVSRREARDAGEAELRSSPAYLRSGATQIAMAFRG